MAFRLRSHSIGSPVTHKTERSALRSETSSTAGIDYPSPNRRTKYAGTPPEGPLVEVVGEEPLLPVEPLDPPAGPLVVDELPLAPVEPVEFPVPEPTGPVTAGGLLADGAGTVAGAAVDAVVGTTVAGAVVAGALAGAAAGEAPAAVTVTVPCMFG